MLHPLLHPPLHNAPALCQGPGGKAPGMANRATGMPVVALRAALAAVLGN